MKQRSSTAKPSSENKKVEIEGQVEQYREVRPVYQLLGEVLEKALTKAVQELGVVGIVQVRAKGIPSFAEKAIRKQNKYSDPVNQLDDLCGARVIVEYKDEIEPVCEFIRKHFEICEAEDVQERLSESEFGYLGIHFIVALKPDVFSDILASLGSAKKGGQEQSVFEKMRKRLYERRMMPTSAQAAVEVVGPGITSVGDPAGKKSQLPPGPVFRAEIQVRTLLQHAWAGFAHDRLYKAEFDVPRRWKRDANRTAAALEEADEDIARAVRGVESYRTYYGSYLKREKRLEEMKTSRMILHYDPDNMRLARKIARLAISLKEWEEAQRCLAKFVKDWEDSHKGRALKATWLLLQGKGKKTKVGGDEVEKARLALEELRDAETSKLLLDYGWARWRGNKPDGRNYMEWAAASDQRNADALTSLADTYVDADEERALDLYQHALRVAPSDPRALAALLYCKTMIERNLKFIPPARASIEEAMGRCRELARANVYLPMAFYNVGLFMLLMGKPYESLTAYARAVVLTDTNFAIDKHLERITNLQSRLKEALPELEWVRLLLMAARMAKLLKMEKESLEECTQLGKKRDEARKKLGDLKAGARADVSGRDTGDLETALEQAQASLDDALNRKKSLPKELKEARSACKGEMLIEDNRLFTRPIVLVAGGCDESVKIKIEEYRSMLQIAFDGFEGVLFSGGTTAGISGLVGDLPTSDRGTTRKVAYLPSSIPSWTARHPNYETYQTTGERFSALEPIQTWIDILAHGVDPADVRLFGINGGTFSAFEYRLAICMGAKAGVIRDSGRAADDLLADENWADAPNLLMLPGDCQTLKVFVQGIPPEKALEPVDLKIMAMETHAKFQQDQKKRHVKQDPAAADWDDLHPDFKLSNFEQVRHIEEKLRVIGLKIRKVSGRPVEVMDFIADAFKDKIERLAEIEHGRWIVERLLSGWRLGERDVEKKRSPYLVSWGELADDIKEYDRQFVRNIPVLLEKHGYEVVPI
jgi:ppGpp synthetase/RelA/SpoT-type nucleotidyltranferase